MHAQGPRRDPQDDGLAPIRARFRATLPEHRASLGVLRTRVEATPSDADLHAIAERAHRIAGVAPTLGFERIGASAAALDAAISRGLTRRQAPPALWAQARPLLARLQRALAEPG